MVLIYPAVDSNTVVRGRVAVYGYYQYKGERYTQYFAHDMYAPLVSSSLHMRAYTPHTYVHSRIVGRDYRVRYSQSQRFRSAELPRDACFGQLNIWQVVTTSDCRTLAAVATVLCSAWVD